MARSNFSWCGGCEDGFVSARALFCDSVRVLLDKAAAGFFLAASVLVCRGSVAGLALGGVPGCADTGGTL